MASFEKYSGASVTYELRHNTRETKRPPANEDIDKSRTGGNFSLAPADRGGALPDNGNAAMTAREYHKQRLSEVYQYGRKDLVTACQWLITAPTDLPPEQEPAFWQTTYDFLNSLYGEKNCVQAIVHTDEGLHIGNEVIAGRNHLHYVFIPVVENEKYQQPNRYGNISGSALYEEKVCADALVSKVHLKEFHPKYQKWLDDHGIHATVYSGTTGGQNKTVEELKRSTLRDQLEILSAQYAKMERELATKEMQLNTATADISTLRAENEALKEKIASLEQLRNPNHEIKTGWDNSPSWGKDIDIEWTR